MPPRPSPPTQTATVSVPPIQHVVGVDFSGAAKSGKTAWIAEMDVAAERRLKLVRLGPLGRFAASDDRVDVCRYLSDRILASQRTLFGMDFPFGLPIELGLGDWPTQLDHVKKFDGNAKDFGRSLVQRAGRLDGPMHIRRATDVETQTPFDCYHYRIIYQTFHGMRDVLGPIAGHTSVAVLPFQYPKLADANCVVVEACPSSTLKRLGLPHQKYKQSGGRPPDEIHRQTRRRIFTGLSHVEISAYQRRVIMRDSGGDALDAVLAAIGSLHAIQTRDHDATVSDDRYDREGQVYA